MSQGIASMAWGLCTPHRAYHRQKAKAVAMFSFLKSRRQGEEHGRGHHDAPVGPRVLPLEHARRHRRASQCRADDVPEHRQAWSGCRRPVCKDHSRFRQTTGDVRHAGGACTQIKQ